MPIEDVERVDHHDVWQALLLHLSEPCSGEAVVKRQ